MRPTVLILAMALLAACTQPSTDVDYNVGGKGLDIGLLGESALENLYEDTRFSLTYSIKNLGIHDLLEDEHAIFTLSFDPFYIETSAKANDNLDVGPGTLTMKGLQLAGKSRYYPTGNEITLYFPNFKTKSITGQRAEPETEIFASLCYPYTTTVSRLVCVDFSAAEQNARTQVCKQKDLSLGRQGAPVAVNLIEVDNMPAHDNLVRPVFTVHISNVGNGNVLSPVAGSAELEDACSSNGVASQDFNTVGIEMELSGTRLDCTPSTIRLNQEEGISRCSVKDEDLERVLSWRQNYESPATVKLSYVYRSTLSSKITIERTSFYPGSADSDEACMPFEVKQGEECISRCEYCADHPSDPQCATQGKYPVAFNPGFSCSCSSKECDTLFTKGLCSPSPSYCSPASYCCIKPCKAGQVMDVSGKCYPKCPACKPSTQQCACGTGQFNIIPAGQACCPQQMKGFGNQTECSEQCTA